MLTQGPCNYYVPCLLGRRVQAKPVEVAGALKLELHFERSTKPFAT